MGLFDWLFGRKSNEGEYDFNYTDFQTGDHVGYKDHQADARIVGRDRHHEDRVHVRDNQTGKTETVPESRLIKRR